MKSRSLACVRFINRRIESSSNSCCVLRTTSRFWKTSHKMMNVLECDDARIVRGLTKLISVRVIFLACIVARRKENPNTVFCVFQNSASTRRASEKLKSPHVKHKANWLILPVIIFLDQRLSHACPRLNKLSVNLRMAHYKNHHLPEHQLTIG